MKTVIKIALLTLMSAGSAMADGGSLSEYTGSNPAIEAGIRQVEAANSVTCDRTVVDNYTVRNSDTQSNGINTSRMWLTFNVPCSPGGSIIAEILQENVWKPTPNGPHNEEEISSKTELVSATFRR